MTGLPNTDSVCPKIAKLRVILETCCNRFSYLRIIVTLVNRVSLRCTCLIFRNIVPRACDNTWGVWKAFQHWYLNFFHHLDWTSFEILKLCFSQLRCKFVPVFYQTCFKFKLGFRRRSYSLSAQCWFILNFSHFKLALIALKN